tara:strand:+ start:4057 stop:4179 length:123 start_codon:yes stop_codon:yes gene_type:complete
MTTMEKTLNEIIEGLERQIKFYKNELELIKEKGETESMIE